jgi:putative membrane protein
VSEQRTAEREYRRLSPLTPVVRGPILLLAFVGASWQQVIRGEDMGVFGFLVIGFLAWGVLYGVVSWARTKYWIDGDELRIDTGVLFRQSRRIRIDRLQGIDIVQPFVARLFGLAELRFDVAAGGDREGSLAFLPHAESLELRRSLLERRDDLRGGTGGSRPPLGGPAPDGPAPDGAAPGGWGSPAGPAGPTSAAPQPERVLARLDLVRLLGSLALSTETLLLGGAAVLMVATVPFTGTFAIAGAVVPALIALGLTLGRKLTSYYDFTLADTPAGLHVRRGLTSLSSQTIAPVRIQGLVVSEPWLWRPAGWARLDVSVAGYRQTDGDQAAASSLLVPVAPREEVLALVRHILDGRDPGRVPMFPPPRRARWLAPLTSWTMAMGQDHQLLVSRRGFFTRRLDIVPQERVQSLQVSQGPVQRRLRLAHVHVDSPPGPVRVSGLHRDPADARAYLEYAVPAGRSARRRRERRRPAATQPIGEVTPPRADTTQ